MEKKEIFCGEGHFSSRILADFPDFDDPRLNGIKIPSRFSYTGWKNDSCPSFADAARGQKLWVDWKDEDERESERPRFQLDRYNHEEEQYEMVLWSDNWQEILQALEK